MSDGEGSSADGWKWNPITQQQDGIINMKREKMILLNDGSAFNLCDVVWDDVYKVDDLKMLKGWVSFFVFDNEKREEKEMFM